VIDGFLDAITMGGTYRGEPSFESTALTLLLAFALGQLVAFVYARTHSGVSYSRTFTQSLVLIAMVVSLALHVIGSNIAAAFGLMGALAIIRFRNVLKDTRDTVFVFIALVLGMAVGIERYSASLVGVVGLLLAAISLSATGFGSRGRFDGHLSVLVISGANSDGWRDVLGRFCRRIQEISARSGTSSDVTEVVLRVRLRDRRRAGEMIAALQTHGGVRDADLVLRDELAEI
jgi:hypothetical protein